MASWLAATPTWFVVVSPNNNDLIGDSELLYPQSSERGFVESLRRVKSDRGDVTPLPSWHSPLLFFLADILRHDGLWERLPQSVPMQFSSRIHICFCSCMTVDRLRSYS